MLSTTEQLRTLAIAVGGVLAIALVLKLGLAKLLATFQELLLASAARPQYRFFVQALRDRLFADPFGVMSALWSGHRDQFVRGLWDELARHAMRPDALPEPQARPLSSQAIRVQRMQLSDGRPLAVVSLPPPAMSGEAYLIGVILPWDNSLKTDRARARRHLRYFVLSKWLDGGPRTLDLCEWTIVHDKPRELTYNIGAPPNPLGFARVIEAKLQELQR